MLVSAIKFEIRDFKNGTFEEFAVENTADNYALIASHRSTRDITIEDVFDFQFARLERIPQFILFAQSVAESFIQNRNVLELDTVDEMNGSY